MISNLDDKIELREETEEEKQARLEMEAEVKKMLENLPPYVKRVVRAVKPLGKSLKTLPLNQLRTGTLWFRIKPLRKLPRVPFSMGNTKP